MAEKRPAFLPTGTFGAGIYAARDYYLDRGTVDYPVVGGHRTFYWNELETPFKGTYRWDIIHDFVNDQAAQGKKAAFGISTYNGVKASRLSIPDWLIAENGGLQNGFRIVECPDGHLIPRYWNQYYLQAYGDFVAALGAEFDGHPNVAWIQIGTGVFGENQPCEDMTPDIYNICLKNQGLDMATWVATSNAITDMYVNAFQTTPVMFQFAPIYQSSYERLACSDHAASMGAGLMHDGLRPDRDAAYGSNLACDNHAGHWDPIVKYWTQVPIAFESYEQAGYMETSTDVYWGILNGLSKHADYMNFGKCLFNLCANKEVIEPFIPRIDNFPIMRFANKYLGRTIHDTPSVWIALRETEETFCPDAGNFEFWLHQDDDAAAGHTVPEWHVGSLKEGRYTRRTDLATGNRFMYFDVDDAYIFGGTNAVTITVRYYDQGFDRWWLQYDATTDIYKMAGQVIKTDSRQWLTQTFRLDDARFANGQTGGNDFRIDGLLDGNEYIHMVDVRKARLETAQIALGPGYNLASLPIVPQETTMPDVLSSIAGKYTKVFAFIDGRWRQYIVGAPPIVNNLTEINERTGFWIFMSPSATLFVQGHIPGTTDIALREGDNLVGYPGTTARPVTEALASIAGKYTKVFGYVDGRWRQYIVGAPPFVNNLTHLEPGYGYWIVTTEACTWVVSN